MTAGPDPITVEVFHHALTAVGEEMAATMRHTARSLFARGGDCSTVLADARGEIIAQGQGTLFHMGYARAVMPFILEKWGDRLGEGDIVAVNDPYQGLSHLPDIVLIAPVIWQGRTIAYTLIVSHQTDIGGRWPGGQGIASAEVFEEGLIIPSVKLYEAGRANAGVLDMIRANVRTPDDVLGDLEALVSATRRGLAGVEALLRRHGADTFVACVEELKRRSERLMCEGLAAVPDGDYVNETLFEDDGLGGPGVKLKLTIRKRGEDVIIDFAGTDPQVRSAVNVPWGVTCSAAYAVCWFLFASNAPWNAGLVRRIDVQAPLGCLVNPKFPAAVGARGLMLWRIVDLLVGAIAKAMPERAMADGEGGVSSFIFIPAGEKTQVMLDFYYGGWGGRAICDGVDGGIPFAGGAGSGGGHSIEQLEAEFPMMVEEHSFVPDTGGAGKFRGALASSRSYRMLSDGRVMIRSCRGASRPEGLVGGEDGTPAYVLRRSGGEERVLPNKMMYDLEVRLGEVLTHVVPSAAGFGDPRERSPEAVLDDVLDGKLTADYAERVYGVAIDASGRVDRQRTAALRSGAATAGRSTMPAPGE
jgi:N-methylhydantoinase B